MSTSRRDRHDAGGRARAPARGAPRSPWCWPTPAPTSSCGAGAHEVVRRHHLAPTRTPTTCRASRCPRPCAATTDAARGPRRAPRSWSSRSRRRRCAATSSAWAPTCRPTAVLVSLMKGIELGTTRRMSEVIAEVTGAGRSASPWCPGPNLAKEIAARQPAASVVACADEAVAEKLQQVCLTAYFRPYTNTDVRRRRARRRGEERHRAGRRHGQGHGDGRQLAGLDHHPRAGRDHPARAGAGRRRRDLRRAGRGRRPGRHLHVAAVAQPHLRREPRPGDEPGRGRARRPGRPPRA